jgi:hypothetical protein
VSEVDPLESKDLGMPKLNAKLEEGKLALPKEERVKFEKGSFMPTYFPKKNKHFIKYFDIPLPDNKENDVLSVSSRQSRKRPARKSCKNKRYDDNRSLIDFPGFEYIDRNSQNNDIDQWDRQSYTGPLAPLDSNIDLGHHKRMKIDDQYDTLSKMSLPDIAEVIDRVKVTKELPTKKVQISNLSSRFEKLEEEIPAQWEDNKLQSVMIEVPALQSTKRTRAKQRIIHDVDIEQNDITTKEDIISKLEYMLRTFNSATQEDLKNQLNTAKKDIYRLNGDFKRYEDYLKGEKVIIWTPLEDLILTKSSTEADEYQILLKEKDETELQSRLSFLNAPSNLFRSLLSESI